ncbi:MAG: alpha/beta hydrolase [Burkholderiales bacterium]|nr:alpha/beta hydrolase [Burkholderiales bacterium]
MLLRAVVTVLVVAHLCSCSGVFFQPKRTWVRTPTDIGLRYEDVRIKAADGSTLSAWFLPAPQKANATLLFLHGNAENISTHIAAVHWLPPRGFNVLLLDYRGYGASEGQPTVAGAQQDIDSAMRYLLARRDIDPSRIIVLAQSLGGALGLHYVAHSAYREQIRGVIIDSAFIGYRDIAREKLQRSWLTWLFAVPLSLTVTEDFRPIDAAPKIAPIPLLLIHGDRDVVVPVHHSEWLYDAAQQPKEVWIVPGAGHIQSLGQAEVRERLVAWLQVQLAK